LGPLRRAHRRARLMGAAMRRRAAACVSWFKMRPTHFFSGGPNCHTPHIIECVGCGEGLAVWPACVSAVLNSPGSGGNRQRSTVRKRRLRCIKSMDFELSNPEPHICKSADGVTLMSFEVFRGNWISRDLGGMGNLLVPAIEDTTVVRGGQHVHPPPYALRTPSFTLHPIFPPPSTLRTPPSTL